MYVNYYAVDEWANGSFYEPNEPLRTRFFPFFVECRYCVWAVLQMAEVFCDVTLGLANNKDEQHIRKITVRL